MEYNIQKKENRLSIPNLSKISNKNKTYSEYSYSDDISKSGELDGDFINLLESYNISEEYYEELYELYTNIENNEKKYKKIIKNWLKETDIPVASILNDFLNSNTELQFQFTDEFIKKHSDAIVEVFLSVNITQAIKGNIKFKFYENILNINSSKKLETRLNSVIKLMKDINSLDITYDEIESQIPNLSEYLDNKIELDGVNINSDTVKKLWDSIINYEGYSAYNIYHALIDIYPSLLSDVRSYFQENDIFLDDDTTRYLIKCFINRAYSNSDFIEDLFSLEKKLNNANYVSAFLTLKKFCKEYDISLLKIGKGVVSGEWTSFIDSFFTDYSTSSDSNNTIYHGGVHGGSGHHR